MIGAPKKKPPSRPTCVIVEDHVMFEQLLGSMIMAEELVHIVSAVHCVEEGIEACLKYQPDLLLLDLALPDGDGLAVARALVKCRPDARVIIISGQADTFRCPPDLKQHICSVIEKTRSFAVVRQEVAECLSQMSSANALVGFADIARLSPREQEIFRMIGRGLSTKEIAAAAFISPKTVETHRKKIAAKLGLRTSAIVRRAALYSLINATVDEH